MSAAEALLWALERDPALSATFATVSILGQPPDFGRLRHRLDRTSRVVPRLRHRVVPALARLAPPAWQVDPGFDLDNHVRRADLPGPGSERQLFDLVTEITTTPFDRSRPLWEFTVVEGLAGGRAALVQKMHHTVTDGDGGVRMAIESFDLGRDQPERDEAPLPEAPAPSRGSSTGAAHLALGTARELLHRQVSLGRKVVAEAFDVARHPSQVVELAAVAARGAKTAVDQFLIADKSRSPLWRQRGLDRQLEVLRLPFDDARRAARALGGSLNDLFVTAAAGAAGAYHRQGGVEVGDLRLAVPVSTRARGPDEATAFAPTRVLVPAGETDPVRRFRCVQQRLSGAERFKDVALATPFARLANTLPVPVLLRMAHQQVGTVDFTASNVRGAPFELFVGGAPVEANYPLGPLRGTAWNLTMVSANGSLDMGLLADTAAVDDPELLRSLLEASFAELLDRA